MCFRKDEWIIKMFEVGKKYIHKDYLKGTVFEVLGVGKIMALVRYKTPEGDEAETILRILSNFSYEEYKEPRIRTLYLHILQNGAPHASYVLHPEWKPIAVKKVDVTDGEFTEGYKDV